MTAIETWVADFALSLTQDDATAERTVTTTLHQRIACGLIQARALECRQLAGSLQIQGLTRNPILRSIWEKLLDRSSELEALGMRMVTEWPKAMVEKEEETPVEVIQ